jgi:hypothetical protein
VNDQMPMFDDPPPVEQPPKKPRKPMRRKAKKAVEKPKRAKKFRKRRIVNKIPFEKEKHPIVHLVPKHIYEVISTLMNLELPLRNFVMEVTKALTK